MCQLVLGLCQMLSGSKFTTPLLTYYLWKIIVILRDSKSSTATITVPIGARTLPYALRIKSYGTNINSFFCEKWLQYLVIQGKHNHCCSCRVLLVTKLINMSIDAGTLPNAPRIKSYGTNINSFFVKILKCLVFQGNHNHCCSCRVLLVTKLINMSIGARTLPNALRNKSYGTNINSFFWKNVAIPRVQGNNNHCFCWWQHWKPCQIMLVLNKMFWRTKVMKPISTHL